MAMVCSPAGRTLLRCLAIVGILFVSKYLLVVKINIPCLLISEVAAWMIPLATPWVLKEVREFLHFAVRTPSLVTTMTVIPDHLLETRGGETRGGDEVRERWDD
ncbi:unnamed protein product [Calypogeia fissa]